MRTSARFPWTAAHPPAPAPRTPSGGAAQGRAKASGGAGGAAGRAAGRERSGAARRRARE